MIESESTNISAIKKKLKPTTILYRIGCVLLIIISLLILAFNIVFDTNPISGESMQPTYNYPNGESQDKAYYSSLFKYERGDIIVVKKVGYSIIKRLIALEGDLVELKIQDDGFYHIFVNGQIINESYLLDPTQNEHLFETILLNFESEWLINVDVSTTSTSISFVVPKNYCFYLGDNRLNSLDCADYGPVLTENITHKVIFVVPDGVNFFVYWFRRIF